MTSEEYLAQERNEHPAEVIDPVLPSSMLRAPPNSPILESSSDFTIWEDIPEPLSTSRATISSANSASQVSRNSVDQIIDHYDQQSSSAPQSQAAVCGPGSELDSYTHQNAAAMRLNASLPTIRQATPLQDTAARSGTQFLYSESADVNTETDTHAPQDALPPISFHSSNPFSILPPAATSRVAESSTPPILDDEDSEYDEASVVRDVDTSSRIGSEEAPSDAESNVGHLISPPARLNSTRRRQQQEQQQRRRRSTGSYSSNSLGVAMNEESDDDPFLYDQPSVFLQPSREREVSARLRKVSGLPRESTATVYSQDGSPSKAYHDGQYFMNDQPLSSGAGKLLDELAGLRAPTHNPFDEMAKRPQHRASASVGGRFYDASALRSEWALGSPDIVKVPVKTQKSKDNRFARGSQNSAEVGGLQNAEEMNWAALRCRDEAQAQAHRMTGNTED